MKNLIYSLVCFCFLFLSWTSLLGQTFVATRGSEQVLIGGSRLFTMEEGTDYRVVGASPSGGWYISTPYGKATLKKTTRFRVLPGGTYGEGSVVLSKIDAKLHSGNSAYAIYRARITSNRSLSDVYMALQWYANGSPVATTLTAVGSLSANSGKDIELLLSIDPARANGNYTVHLYSGGKEIRLVEQNTTGDW